MEQMKKDNFQAKADTKKELLNRAMIAYRRSDVPGIGEEGKEKVFEIVFSILLEELEVFKNVQTSPQ